MSYDQDNIFAKILRKELTADIVYENDHVLAFHDKYPKEKVHVIIIPKGSYKDYVDFITHAAPLEQLAFSKGIVAVCESLKLSHFVLLTRKGSQSGQEIFHYHVHILST